MNILVTGGAGYIGSILVPELLEAGHKVTVIDNFMYRKPSLANSISNPNLELIYGDIRNQSLMKSLINTADIVVPLAAIVGAPVTLGATTTDGLGFLGNDEGVAAVASVLIIRLKDRLTS